MNNPHNLAVVAFIRVVVVLVTMLFAPTVKADKLFNLGENYLYQVVEINGDILHCLTWQPEEAVWSKSAEPVKAKIARPFIGQVFRIAIHGENGKTAQVIFDENESLSLRKKLDGVKKKPQVERYRTAFEIAAQVAKR